MHTIAGILLALILAVCLVLYFLPTIVAHRRNPGNQKRYAYAQQKAQGKVPPEHFGRRRNGSVK